MSRGHVSYNYTQFVCFFAALSMTKEGPSRTLVRLPKPLGDDQEQSSPSVSRSGNEGAGASATSTPRVKGRSPLPNGPSPAEELLQRLQGKTVL